MKKSILKHVIYMTKLFAISFIIECLTMSFLLAWNGNAQVKSIEDVKVYLSLEDVKVEKAFKELEKHTNYNFVFATREIKDLPLITFEGRGQSLYDILRDIAIQASLNFKQVDLNIHVKKSLLNQTVSVVEKEDVKVNGTVTDANGEPIPGVTVSVVGTTVGTATDLDGNYFLTVPEGATLAFSFIGFVTQSFSVGDRSVIDVVMAEDMQRLEEVVVVGYGIAKKTTITGSVSTVSGEKLKVAQPANFSNSLVGRIPGLVSVTSRGVPGDDEPTIRIRGNNTLNNNNPLIVVDGVPDRGMSRLSSYDIESVTVLKDASAAIFGSRAANGVILITTKRGTTDKLKTSITFNQGFSSPTVLPEMAPSWLYATMMNEVDMYAGQEPRFSEEDIQKYKDGTQPYSHPNTDWWDEVFKPFSLETNANVNIRGGTENLKYFASIGGRYQDATYERSGSNFSQINFRSNIDAKLSEYLDLAINIAGRQENRQFPVASRGNIFRNVPRGKPTDVAWWFGEFPGPDVESDYHPGVMVSDIPGYDKSTGYVFESNLKLDFEVPWVKGLSLNGNLSVDKDFSHGKLWQVPFDLYVWDKQTYDENGLPLLLSSKRGISDPRLDQSMSQSQRITSNLLAYYDKSFSDKHFIKLLAGTESIVGESGNFSALRKYYLSEAITELFAGSDLEKDNKGSGSEFARMNYFGRVNYDFLSKYLFEFVWRYDGSYIFPQDKRWGFFPGFSAGWVISEENFWENSMTFFDFFKIRGSWGQTGNDRIAEFQYLATYGSIGSTGLYNGVNGDQWVWNQNEIHKTLEEKRIPNKNVTWEVANQSNIGLEARMLNGKLSFEGDYFYNIRSNILIQRSASVPHTAGFTLPPENIGEVINRGFEFDIGYGDQRGEFDYFVSVNGGYSKDKVAFWDEEPGVPEYQKKEGHPMQSELYYQEIGIFRDQEHVDSYPHWAGARPGDIIFEDVNDDGSINGLDRVRDYRGSIPRFVGGFNLDITYKNFYLTTLFQGALGKIRYHYVESGVAGNYYMVDAEGRWTPDNPDAEKPRAFSYVGEYWRHNSQRNTYWLRNADYVRLKNMEIGYNFPQSINSKLGTSDLRIYVSGSNLLTWCPDIEDFDPESTTSYWDYPVHKVINVGVTIGF